MAARGCIYKATCKTTGKSYVGQTRDSNGFDARQKRHLRLGLQLARGGGARSNSIFHRAIAKYGADAFTWEVLLRCEVAQLDDAETAAIAEHRTVSPAGYNIREGESKLCAQTSMTSPRGIALCNLRARMQDLAVYAEFTELRTLGNTWMCAYRPTSTCTSRAEFMWAIRRNMHRRHGW